MFHILVSMMGILTFMVALLTGVIFVVYGYVPMVERMCYMLVCSSVLTYFAASFIMCEDEE